MAQVEPMDIDAIESDFDNKENAFQCNNVLSRTPCTEKGYEELDVSDLNMKLRFSITPASSPMSKSLTGPCLDNRSCNSDDDLNNAVVAENGNLTRSLNSTLSKTESLGKSKVLPLQTLSTEPFIDSNRNSSMRRLLDQTDNNVIISVDNANDIDENLSLPSPCSSVPDTPEATTPTKEIPKPEGSPIMRGLKSVLSMFRPSQSPILPTDDKSTKQEILSPVELGNSEAGTVQVSTPVTENKQKDANSSRRSSPLKESLVFNDDLERELLWKDETTIIFKDEKIPVHKLFFQNQIATIVPKTLNTTVEHMDISCNDSIIVDKSNTNIDPSDQSVKNEHAVTGESDNEFLDCETTFTKNESYVKDKNGVEMDNEIQTMENITIACSNNAEIPIEINSECKNVLKYNDVVTTGDITICTGEASVSTTGVSSKIDNRNNTNVIEATINLLCSESIDYSKMSVTQDIDLKNKSQGTKELQLADQNTMTFVDSKDNDVINPTEDRSFPTLNIRSDIAPPYNLKGEEMKESVQHIFCDREKLPEDGVESLNNIDNDENRSNESLSSIETKKNNNIVADIAVTVNILGIDSSTFINRFINTQSFDVIGNAPNIDKPNMSNELVSSQNLAMELNNDLLTNNEDTKVAQNNDIPLNNDNLTSTFNSSDNVEDILGDDHNINKDKATKSKVYMPILKDSETPLNVKNPCPANYSSNLENDLDDNHKIISDMPVTESAKGENDMPIDTITLPSLKIFDNPITSTVKFEALNATIDVDSKSDFIKVNRTLNSNLSDMKGILEINRESLQKNSENNLELKVDDNILTSDVVNNKSFVVDKVSSNGCEVHELQIGNTTICNSPSEIPLPDEDDIKQNILDMDGMCIKNFNEQDITSFNICDIDYTMNVESELIVYNATNAKCDQSKITLNQMKEYDGTSVISSIIESNGKLIDNEAPLNKEINDLQNCNTRSAHINQIDVETLDVRSENLEQNKTNFNLQTAEDNILPKENFSNHLFASENNFNKIDDDGEFSKAQTSEHMVSKPLENNLSDNTEQISVITKTALANAEKLCDVTSLDKHESTNQEEMGEKGVDEIDEELITSANNSPYVSVTDLDKVVEKVPNDTKKEIDIPLATNTTYASSPPTSPKIVSKGYNFNFDEIDDPFATKTKIRMSPTDTPDTPNQTFPTATEEIKTIQEVPKKFNRRKSQPERKRPIQKKNMNSTFNDKLTTKESTSEKQINSAVITPTDNALDNISTFHVKNNISERKLENSLTTDAQSDDKSQKFDDISKSVTSNAEQVSSFVPKQDIKSSDVEIKNIEQTLVVSTQKSTSSSEQYFSLGTSSGESSSVMNRSKNVFNLPEIDDLNFNPFATKSKMRMSPPPAENPKSSLETLNYGSNSPLIIQNSSDNNSTINIDTEHTFDKKIENDSLSNTSNTTLSSKNTNDIDNTVREIPTEDEDTVEGPFLEFDDLKDNQKVTDMDIDTDMMNFEEISQQEREENLENGELFIDADAFEFLLNQNKSTTVLDSGKESLFLKFDPLFAKRVSSDGILAALSKAQKRQSTPKKVTQLKQQDLVPVEKSTAGPSNIENCGLMEDYNDDLSSNVTKPMMVVNPAVSSVITQKRPVTPKLNRRSLTFTSPAMAVIDRLLSLSGNSSHSEHNASIPRTGREHSDTDLAITQLRELLAEKEINVHTLRSESKELKDRLAALELQVRGLETESSARLAKINELNERLFEKTKINKSMAIVVEEYERTIASLIAETEQDKKRNAEERMRLIKERDEQTAHLTSMEVSFSDLHSKYEKSKQIILSCKANEDIYKKSIKEFQDNFSKMQNNYELLKQHATSKLNHANQELEKMNRAHDAEVLKMNAMIKRKELHITSLEETLTQKTKANEELTAICDELINKVG